MKKYGILSSLLILLLLFNCKNDDDGNLTVDEDQANQLVVLEEQISHTTVDLVWEAVTANNGAAVSYDIMLDGELLKEKNQDTDFTLTGLNASTSYEGEIIAREDNTSLTGKASTAQPNKEDGDVIKVMPFNMTTKTFDDPNAPVPGDFNVTIDEVGKTDVNFSWSPATMSDGSSISYDIYLEGDKVGAMLSNNQYTISSLTAGKRYDGEIVAISSNQKATSTSFTFDTLDASLPGDFAITVGDITFNSAVLQWNRPSVTNNSPLSYTITLDGSEEVNGLTGGENLTYVLENLNPSSGYSGTIEALNTDTGYVSVEVFSFETPIDDTMPGRFTVTVSDVTSNSAVLQWDRPSVTSDTPLSYTVKLGDIVVASGLTGGASLTYTLEDLSSSSGYSGTIEALNTDTGYLSEEVFSFETLIDDTMPGRFAVTVSDVTSNSAVLQWDRPSVTSDTPLSYTVKLGNIVVASGLTGGASLSYTLEDLSSSSGYSGTIEALNTDTGYVSEEAFSFETPMDDSTPGDFTIFIVAVSSHSAELEWERPSVSNNSPLSYSITLNGVNVVSGLTAMNYILENLNPSSGYSGTIEALNTDTGYVNVVPFSFETPMDDSIPGRFVITISDVTANSAILQWDRPSVTNNSPLSYTITLDGFEVANGLTGGANLTYVLENLSPSAGYNGTIQAINTDTGYFSEEQFTFETPAQ